MVTIKDVAKHANVSVATVSRVIRNTCFVCPETRQRVLDAVEELGYVVDQVALQLRRGESNTIGIIVSDVNNFFYNTVISGLETKLKAQDVHIMLTYSNEDSAEERQCFRTLLAAKVSTILFSPVDEKNYDMVRLAMDNGIRVIQLYRCIYRDVSAVIFDDEDSAYMATHHLAKMGCRRPMLIDVRYSSLPADLVVPNRSLGFLKAMEELGITEYLTFPHSLVQADSSLFRQIFLDFQPDGIVSGTNLFTVELLRVMENAGLRYPDDLKVVSFDDIDWLSLLKLTAIRQPVDRLIQELTDILSYTGEAKLVKIKSDLIIRDSTDSST